MSSATSPAAAAGSAARGTDDVVLVRAKDVTGDGAVFCPNPAMTLWNTHPRVFIDIATTGEGRCSYCGTRYRLAPGETLGHGH